MKKALRLSLVLLFSLALMLLVSSCAREEKGITVGTLMAHTGDLKEMGAGIRRGISLAAMQFEEAGLTVKLVHEDSETSPIPGTNAARKLVDIDKVVAVIGSIVGNGDDRGILRIRRDVCLLSDAEGRTVLPWP